MALALVDVKTPYAFHARGAIPLVRRNGVLLVESGGGTGQVF